MRQASRPAAVLSRIPAWLAGQTVRFYRAALSPLFPGCCRYYPTCSAYMLGALSRFGFWRGGMLGAGRLLRCHPWAGHGGIDPVPKRFAWRAVFGYKRGQAAAPDEKISAAPSRNDVNKVN